MINFQVTLKYDERMSLVAQLVCKISSGRLKPSVAGSIPALSAII